MADVIYVPKSDILDLITGEYEAGSFTDYSNYSNLWDAVDDMPAADVQPVKQGRWIGIYEWAKMHDSTPSGMCTYFWCSECQTEQEKKSNFCPNCGARMYLNSVTHDRCSNYMDCDGNCFIDDTPCDCDGNIEKCKGR